MCRETKTRNPIGQKMSETFYTKADKLIALIERYKQEMLVLEQISEAMDPVAIKKFNKDSHVVTQLGNQIQEESRNLAQTAWGIETQFVQKWLMKY